MIRSPAHRILCIEDDSRLRRLLIEDLSEAGFEVVSAGNAAAGIDAFFTHRPSLVLCDIRMPVLSGFDFFERLKRLDTGAFGAAFIFLTALADRDSELRGRRLGADDYITKPVDYEILREVIHVRLAGRHVHPVPTHPERCMMDRLSAWFQGAPQDPPAGLISALGHQFGMASGTGATGDDLDRSTPMLAEMLETLPFGVMILDKFGTVYYVNESAAVLLGEPRQDLAARRAAPCLAAFVRRHAAGGDTEPKRITADRLPLGPGGEITAIVRLAAVRGSPNSDRYTVLFPSLPRTQPTLAGFLQVLFGLTPAERRLATEITGGANLADVAASRGVTLGTLRAQLKSVFSKVGVARQSELIRTLLALQMAVDWEWRNVAPEAK
jgi:CheY-like chemotaxis protein/DNA-binding CsgD family transcriptional regulator